MNPTASLPLTDAPERIAQLIWVLCQTVTTRCSLRVRALSGAQVAYIVAKLLAARKRFRAVVERVRAGDPPAARARKPRARPVRPRRPTLAELERDMGSPPPPGWRRWAREDRARARALEQAEKAARAAASREQPLPLWRRLRQHMAGWLCPLAPAIPEFPHSAPGHASHLRQILAEPGMQALLLEYPAVGAALRDVCHALGVERSLLHLAPPLVAAPALGPGEPAAQPGGAPPGETAVAMSPAANMPAGRPMAARQGAEVAGTTPPPSAAPRDQDAPDRQRPGWRDGC